MKKVIIIIFLITTLGAYYMGTKVNENLEPVVTIIDLRDSEKKQIAQDAVLGWIHPDSILTVTKIKWEVKDSTNWTFLDSTRWDIKDSTVVVYIPFYEGKDTIVKFDETVDEVRVQLSLAIMPRYFPTYQKFVTDVKLMSLTVTIPHKTPSRWGLGIYGGFGIGYSYQAGERNYYNDNGFQTISHDHEGWYYGWQLGVGLTYDVVRF